MATPTTSTAVMSDIHPTIILPPTPSSEARASKRRLRQNDDVAAYQNQHSRTIPVGCGGTTKEERGGTMHRSKALP